MTALGNNDRLLLPLRELYQTYGYRQYQVGKFEEYDLYARFRNFLTGEHILTFNDINGQLMALKPDVTLSVVKNTRGDDRIRKVWYTENVYRVPRNSDSFREILQTGLECIGSVDLYTMAEVLMLAARSLETISPAYVLEVSHIGILSGLLSSWGVHETAARTIINAFGEKNLPAVSEAVIACGLDEQAGDLLRTLCQAEGRADDVLRKLRSLPLPAKSEAAVQELCDILDVVRVFGDHSINLDLSVTNDTEYYNGLIFRGFIDGVSCSVLSGGQYDHLLHSMGKSGSAIGFAIYMSELERLFAETGDKDFDVLLTYQPGTDPIRIAETVKSIVSQGASVRAQKHGASAATYDKLIEMESEDTAEWING